jgi:hypothetical protein
MHTDDALCQYGGDEGKGTGYIYVISCWAQMLREWVSVRAQFP